MTTVILNNAGDKRITVITRQYICGLYVALYREDGSVVPEQTVSGMKEKAYHKRLRKNFKWIPEESTPI